MSPVDRNSVTLAARLRELLRLPLPGAAAHAAMAPAYRLPLPSGPPPGGAARRASVIVLLYPAEGSLRFPLILRPESPGPHGSQVGLPGGGIEAGESAETAALRELEEELGVARSGIEILGALSALYIPPSGFLILPFVGLAPERPAFRPSPAEVAGLVEARLETLLDPAFRRLDEREIDGSRWSIPYYEIGGLAVWGATAMILSELARLVAGAGEAVGVPGPAAPGAAREGIAADGRASGGRDRWPS